MSVINSYLEVSNQAVLADLGQKVESARLRKNLRQEDLAQLSGVSHSTIKKVERGKSVGTLYFIAIVRGLGEIASLEAWLPVPAVRPMEMQSLKGRKRQRASSPADSSIDQRGHKGGEQKNGGVHEPSSGWTWGDSE